MEKVTFEKRMELVYEVLKERGKNIYNNDGGIKSDYDIFEMCSELLFEIKENSMQEKNKK